MVAGTREHDRPLNWTKNKWWRRVWVDPETGCWLWTGTLNDYGYGRYGRGLTHRIAYTAMRGDIPLDRELDHLCRNRRCCNPRHIEVVTARENTLRGMNPTAVNARKSHCPQGHPYAGANLEIRLTGARRCRTCSRAEGARRRARQKMESHE